MPRGSLKHAPLMVGTLESITDVQLAKDSFPLSARDREAIGGIVESFAQAWFQGDAAAMERCLHPDLTARLFQAGPGPKDMGPMQTLARTQGIQASLGASIDPEDRRCEISVLDVRGRAASARAILGYWVAYLHLMFTGGRWAVVNVMWEWA